MCSKFGKRPTQYYIDVDKKIQVRWRFFKPTTERIAIKQIRTWKDFLSWMVKQSMRTEIDFNAEEWRWTLSIDKEWLKIEEEGEAKWSQQQGNNNEH